MSNTDTKAIEDAYLQGFHDGRVYAAAAMAGLQTEQRPRGYCDEYLSQRKEVSS